MRATYPIIVMSARLDEPDWLVDDLRTNTAWADGHAVVDNRLRARESGWQNEGTTRRLQREAALRVTGGRPCWVIQLDPDERLQDSASDVIPRTLSEFGRTERSRRSVFGFPLREMWTPTEYRTDGPWLRKKPRRRVFFLTGETYAQRFPNKPIHCGVVPTWPSVTDRITLDVWLYHLKSIEPENRVRRADAYHDADPGFRYQRPEAAYLGRAGWDWLHDESGLTTEPVPNARRFSPPYTRPYVFVRPGGETA